MTHIKIIHSRRTETIRPRSTPVVTLDPVEMFDPRSFFVHGSNGITKLCINESFQREVVEKSSRFLSVPSQNITAYPLLDSFTDHELLLDFRPEAIYTIDELLAAFVRLFEFQPAGESGMLSLEHWNRFYFVSKKHIASVKLRWNPHPDFRQWTPWYVPFGKEDCNPGECIVHKHHYSSA